MHFDTSIAAQEASPISIHVFPDNSIRLNGELVLIEQLPMALKDAKNKFPGVRPQVFHDKRAHFGTYQSIKNAAESVGYQQLDIVLKPG